MGNWTWYKASNFLTISPNGDKELLKQIKEIVSLAPELLDWEFYYAKQPRQSDLVFVMYFGDAEIRIDANAWEYVLLEYPDKTYDIIVKVENLMGLTEDTWL